MEPLLILAGIPARLAAERPQFDFQYPRWECRRHDAQSKDSWWPEVLRQVADHEKRSRSGVHILAFTKDRHRHRTYKADIARRHRLLFVPYDKLSLLGSTDFCTIIDSYVDFEAAWREHLRPTKSREPLILPETQFVVSGRLSQVWDEVANVRGSKDNIYTLKNAIETFRSKHFVRIHSDGQSKEAYRDDGGKDGRYFVFDHSTEHSLLATHDSWKFTFRIPRRFHYRVQSVDGEQFIRLSLSASRRQRTFEGCVSVYPDGTVNAKPVDIQWEWTPWPFTKV